MEGSLLATIELTETMLKKSAINATQPIRDILIESGICDYSVLDNGAENGINKPCTVYANSRSWPSAMRMYKPSSKNENRFWVSALGSYADRNIMEISISVEGEISIFINPEQDLAEAFYSEDNVSELPKDPYPVHDLSDMDTDGKLDHHQVTFAQVMNGDIIYVMPRFQREYSWYKPQFTTFWNDVNAVWFREEPRQFLGPLVMRVDKPRSGLNAGRTWVVDGQQRLTTIYAINIAIAKIALESGYKEFAETVATLLFIKGPEEDIDKPSIAPTVKDQKQFNDLLRKIEDTRTKMHLMADYGKNTLLEGGFKNHLKKGVRERCTGIDGKISLEKLRHLYDIINFRMLFIQIDVPKSLNVHKVFDRLNTQGKRLETADLIRNLIFEKLIDEPEEADQLFNQSVLPMERRFEYLVGSEDKPETKSKLSEYYFPFALTLGEDKLTKGNMFEKLRSRWKDSSSEEVFSEINSLVDPYLSLVFGTDLKLDKDHPLRANSHVRKQINRLFRLNIPSGTFPFLMPLLKYFIEDQTKAADVVKCLEIIESFQVRRNYSGFQSAGYQTLFRTMWEDCGSYPDPKKLMKNIQNKSGYDYPDDENFAKSIERENLYNKSSLSRYITNEIELSISAPPGHEAQVLENYRKSTTEHIIPQNFDQWKDKMDNWDIPDEYDDIDDWLSSNIDTLANLTVMLPWQNSELQNSPWSIKRDYYRNNSIYRDNTRVAETEDWNIEAHKKRSASIIEWALKRWPYFGET